MYDAWKAGSRALLPMADDDCRHRIEKINAKVLSNRRPPYSLAGGLFDALTDTEGEFFLASNEEGTAAAELFKATEGNDIHPAAAIATASLINAVKERRVEKDAIIMLNITGCGEERFKSEHSLFMLKPSVVFDFSPSLDEVREKIPALFA